MKNCDILERAQFMIVQFFMKLNMNYNNTIPITHCVRCNDYILCKHLPCRFVNYYSYRTLYHKLG